MVINKDIGYHTSIDTIIIIGNGFDIWQDLGTNYSEFQRYYLEHREEILKKLHIKKKTIIYEDGHKEDICDVELIYGDPFDPHELDDEFWGAFESSLSEIDAERINWFFGKDRNELKELRKSINNAKKILRQAFCDWIGTLKVDNNTGKYSFGDNCYFINFNYTDTLEKRFHVHPDNICHIHGSAGDKDSIIFGHSKHPQKPEPLLYSLGGRFRGLYYIDNLLYETDKHVQNNIEVLIMTLALRGIFCENIKKVYVLGHSMSPPDLEYFLSLVNATQVQRDNNNNHENEKSIINSNDDEQMLRLQYIVDHTGYGIEEEKMDFEVIDAMKRKQRQDVEESASRLSDAFMKMLRKKRRKKNINQKSEEYNQPARKEDAKWTISYHGEESRIWADYVMKALGCRNYELIPSIDECLKGFEILR